MRTQGNFQINSVLGYIKNFKRSNFLKLHLPVNRFQMYTSLAYCRREQKKGKGGGISCMFKPEMTLTNKMSKIE